MRAIVALLILVGSLTGKPMRIELADGSAEFDWLNSVAFRLTRSWHISRAPLTTANLVLESATLKVEIEPATLKTRITTLNGRLIAELPGPSEGPGKILLDRKIAPGERIQGQTGATADPPFFFSSLGYGQMIGGAKKYLVDAGKTEPDRLRVTAQGSDKIDTYFFYGPSPKEIFEQRKTAAPVPETLPSRTLDLTHLDCEAIRKMNAESLAAQFYEERVAPEWESYIGAYIREIHDRGLPIIRPLSMQFHKDPNSYKAVDITMFGDELLVAPRCAGTITLPQGLWTDLKTDVEYKSRSTVKLQDDVTLFARNGSIVPLRRKDVVELHYFPKLGAEFFIYEPDVTDYSQVHASQATDFWRLEIESKVARSYEWVLHHIGENPKRIHVDAKAGSDNILNLPL